MSPDLQSIVALIVVAFAAGWLIWRTLQKRKNPGCGTDCGAVSPEVRRLQSEIKRRNHRA